MAKPTKPVFDALEVTDKVIHAFRWGPHCPSDPFLAHIVNAAREFLERQPNGYERTKEQVQMSHWQMLAVWFATGRGDLQKSLFEGGEDIWQEFGFPAGYTAGVRETIQEVQKELIEQQ